MSRNAKERATKIREIAGFPHAGVSGPSFETVAEIKAIRTLGADAVGMSDEPISHEHTKAMVPLGAAKPELVLRAALPHI